MTVPVEIQIEDTNRNYRMFLQKNENTSNKMEPKFQVSFTIIDETTNPSKLF